MKSLLTILAVRDKWFFDVFQAIREKEMATMNSDYIEVMVILASIIIAFKLIKLSYTIMSDEQNGGFGGISMWEVLRPLVMLVILINASWVLGLLDSTCNYISTALVNDSGYTLIKVKTATIADILNGDYEKKSQPLANQKPSKEKKEVIADAKTRIISALDSIKTISARHNAPINGPYIESSYGNTTNGETQEVIWKKNEEFFSKADALKNSLNERETQTINDAIKALEQEIALRQEGTNIRAEAEKALASSIGAQKRLQKGTTFMAAACDWLFNMLFTVMMAFSEIFLFLMAMMFPISITLGLFDKWKDSLSSWIGRYIEISAWKITGALICVAVLKAKAAALEYVAESNNIALDALSDFSRDFTPDQLISLDSALIISTCIALAGIISLISIPSITNTAISLSSEAAVSGAETGGGTAKGILFAPAKATAGGVKGANALKGLKK